jgi:hypothetical protein
VYQFDPVDYLGVDHADRYEFAGGSRLRHLPAGQRGWQQGQAVARRRESDE